MSEEERSPADEPRVEIAGGQGVQVGSANVQTNTFIDAYAADRDQYAIGRDITVVNNYSRQVSWPVFIGDIPREPPAFQPREHLQEALQSYRGYTVSALIGMQGVGKTELAAAYARSRIAAGWRMVAWIDAGDSARLLNGLAEVATRLRLIEGGGDLAASAIAVRHWLESDGERCLIVFDNAIDLPAVRRLLPAGGNAQIVITSHLQAAAALGEAITVGVFRDNEAVAFLSERTASSDLIGAHELASQLGYLPLALAQAAAVIARQRLDYAIYLNRLQTLPVSQILTRGADAFRGITESVLLSLESAGASNDDSIHGAVLDMVALLSTAGVSRSLLYAAAHDGALRKSIDPNQVPITVDAALAQLADSSLLTFSMDRSSVSGHRLVMRVVRELRAQQGTLVASGSALVRLLQNVADSLRPVWQNPGAARDLIEQIVALDEHVAPFRSADDSDLSRAFLSARGWVLWSLDELGDNPLRAIGYGEPLVTDSERLFGFDHPNTLSMRNNLAYAYDAAGRFDQAIPLFELTAGEFERLLGSDNPDTLTTRNNLAGAYRAAGNTDQAIALYERTLTDRARVLGSDHPDTLTTQNNLAGAYLAEAQTNQAIALYERTLTDRERVLGSDHPSTLTTRNNLAAAYRAAGRIDEAIPLFERTLADRERILGTNHPETLITRNNLAAAYQDAGRIDEAIPLFERILADRERILGSDHRSTLTTQNNLAAAYQAAGRIDEAVTLFQGAIAGFERTLGVDHPVSRTVRENLASAIQAMRQS